MSKNYIIVGREVGEAKYFLHGDGRIDEIRGDDGKPLTVAHIGERVVELSETGAVAEGTPEYEQIAEEFKHALQVIEQPIGTMTEAEKEAIWEKTTVVLKWDTREPEGDTDKNTRIIVIPADNTHTQNIQDMQGQQPGLGFPPPLTYPLDIDLVFSGYITRIFDAVGSYTASEPELEIDGAQRNALMQHIRAELLEEYILDPNEDRPQILSKQAVLEQRIVSYYRAVGIYITLMCK